MKALSSDLASARKIRDYENSKPHLVTLDGEVTGLPYTRMPCPGKDGVPCGRYAIELVDGDEIRIRCKACGREDYVGDRGATTWSFEPVEQEDGTFLLEVSPEVEADIVKAKAKPPKDQTPKEKDLAAVDLTDKESKPKKAKQ